MKLTVVPKSKNEILSLLELADSFIIGIDTLSVNFNASFSINETKEIITIIKNNNKEIFISLNKNMHNEDIPYLNEVLEEIEKLGVTGILYYDLAIPNLRQKLNLKTPLVWAQEHLTTNQYTCNFWSNQDIEYVLLSGEITEEEIIEIKQNTNIKTIVPVFGHLPMFESRRHLVKNYLEFFNLKDESTINYIEKEGNVYPIIDSDLGTTIYSSYILNGIKESLNLKDNGIDYAMLNSFGIEDDLFKNILTKFKEVNIDNVDKYQNEIDSKLKTDRGFLYKETVYKVKTNV